MGLKVNYNKTEILRIGSLRLSDAEYYLNLPLVWSDGPITVLGVKIDADMSENSKAVRQNYEDLLNKITGLIKQWQLRDLTLMGKIQVINSLVVSQFVYQMSVLPTPPEEYFQRYKTLIKEFLWEGKKPKIRYNKLIQRYNQGGLQLQDLQPKCKVQKINMIVKLAKNLKYIGT